MVCHFPADEVNSKIITVSTNDFTQPVVKIEEKIEKAEAATQTKETVTKDQEVSHVTPDQW